MQSIIKIYENETGNKMPTNYLGFLEWHKDYIKWLELSLSILIFCNNQKELSAEKKFTKEEVLDAIRLQWIKDYGNLNNENERDYYFMCGFIKEALN